MKEQLSMKDFVFRFRSYNEKSIDAFEKNRLYFSTPSYFNDPFDARLFIDKKKLFKTIMDSLDNGMEAFLDSQVASFSSGITAENKSIFLQYSQSQELRNEFITAISNDIDNIKDNILKTSKIICFSEAYLSTLMWAHYADFHKGFALMYPKSELSNAKIYSDEGHELSTALILDKVTYSNTMPDCGKYFYNYLPARYKGYPYDYAQIFHQLMYTKMLDWNYEQEWRLCSVNKKFPDVDKASYISIQPVGLFLGAKISAVHKLHLYSIAKEKNIAIFEVWVNDRSPEFKLNFCKVPDVDSSGHIT